MRRLELRDALGLRAHGPIRLRGATLKCLHCSTCGAQYTDVVAAGNRPPALSEVEYCEYAVIARYGLRLLPRMRPYGLSADTRQALKAKPCAQLRRAHNEVYSTAACARVPLPKLAAFRCVR